MNTLTKIYDTLSLYPPNTQKVYKRTLKDYLNFTGGNLTPYYLQDYINKISKENSPASVRVKYYALKKIFNILKYNIDNNIILPRKLNHEPQILTKEQLKYYYKLVNKINNNQVRTILLLLPRTGLRISEILNLKVSDIKFQSGIVYIVIYGKGNKIRKVTLNKKAYSIIYEYIKNNNISDRLFAITDELVRYYLRRLRKVLKCEFLTPHTLRHTFASILLQKGVDVKTISELLGHHSVVFTLKTYCHTTLEQKQHAVEIIDK